MCTCRKEWSIAPHIRWDVTFTPRLLTPRKDLPAVWATELILVLQRRIVEMWCCFIWWLDLDFSKDLSWVKRHYICSKHQAPFNRLGQDSSVGIATRYGLCGPGIESWWGRDFLPLSRLAPPPFSAEVKERVELYLHSPSRSSWPVLERTLPYPYHLPSDIALHHRRQESCIAVLCKPENSEENNVLSLPRIEPWISQHVAHSAISAHSVVTCKTKLWFFLKTSDLYRML
jgi:hypothetical protein